MCCKGTHYGGSPEEGSRPTRCSMLLLLLLWSNKFKFRSESVVYVPFFNHHITAYKCITIVPIIPLVNVQMLECLYVMTCTCDVATSEILSDLSSLAPQHTLPQ